MSNIFTDYPKTSEVPLEEAEVSKLKKLKKKKQIKKILKKLKKQKKLIKKISKQKVESENCTSSKCNTDDGKIPTQDNEKSFFNRMKDKFIDAVPSICRTVAKTVTTLVLGWAFKHFGKWKAA